MKISKMLRLVCTRFVPAVRNASDKAITQIVIENSPAEQVSGNKDTGKVVRDNGMLAGQN
ncbi:hypothetical protein [Cohnella nanjingensis]|uniref:hypothetical protein n=1 Tax=Cohnella nanjingensis TaxID=1387779 RepID=UPI001C87967C|nr:hypothetical protein [Cohnella nanjingensis]